MARYCISYDTMSKVDELTGEETQEQLVGSTLYSVVIRLVTLCLYGIVVILLLHLPLVNKHKIYILWS